MARQPSVFVRSLTMEEGRRVQKISRIAKPELAHVFGMDDGSRL
ncbi:hypothetical protein [Rhodococcus rhodochrous]|nr:hypothetical protein [Rhodococcus rhodochrous]MCQ4137393.1 hypothetical protein [Rhodococcus rhodochrous]MDJ0021241.1 hypothetical protein [Rhodococcus rhodochrous]